MLEKINVIFDGETYTIKVPGNISKMYIDDKVAFCDEIVTMDTKPSDVYYFYCSEKKEVELLYFDDQAMSNPYITPSRHLGDEITSVKGIYSRSVAIAEIAREYLVNNGFTESKKNWWQDCGLQEFAIEGVITNRAFTSRLDEKLRIKLGKTILNYPASNVSGDMNDLVEMFNTDREKVISDIISYEANIKVKVNKQDVVNMLKSIRSAVMSIDYKKRSQSDFDAAIGAINQRIRKLTEADEIMLAKLRKAID